MNVPTFLCSSFLVECEFIKILKCTWRWPLWKMNWTHECFISATVRARSDWSLLAKVTAVISEKSKGSDGIRIQTAIKPFLSCTKETVSCIIHYAVGYNIDCYSPSMPGKQTSAVRKITKSGSTSPVLGLNRAPENMKTFFQIPSEVLRSLLCSSFNYAYKPRLGLINFHPVQD